MMKYVFYILIVSLFATCGDSQNLSPVSKSYIDEVITLLQNNSINKNKINWEDFRDDVYRHAKGSKTIENTYPSITYAITKLEDNHSYFAANIVSQDTSDLAPLPILADEITPDDIGYIRIPFCIGNESEYNDYIMEIRAKIEKESQNKLKGWIIDLRGNFGGNMWPMLLSIEPLIGNGTFGYFIDANENSEVWKIIEGKAYIEDQFVMETKILSKQDLSNQFLAVLTDNQTASSGEAVAVALKLRENSKSFGQSTFGVSTGCVSHELSDGSIINLAESIFADRKKTKFGHSVYPDVKCDINKTLEEAINWISMQH
jgi:carboxyl-terminal processing protease